MKVTPPPVRIWDYMKPTKENKCNCSTKILIDNHVLDGLNPLLHPHSNKCAIFMKQEMWDNDSDELTPEEYESLLNDIDYLYEEQKKDTRYYRYLFWIISVCFLIVLITFYFK